MKCIPHKQNVLDIALQEYGSAKTPFEWLCITNLKRKLCLDIVQIIKKM